MKYTCRENLQIKLIIAQSHISIEQEGLYCKLNNGACTIIPYPIVEVKHILVVHVTSELKIKLLCFFTYTHHNINFHRCEKQIFKSSGIRKDSK